MPRSRSISERRVAKAIQVARLGGKPFDESSTIKNLSRHIEIWRNETATEALK